jgi:predicted TPR repeat methyltransferase
MPRVKTSVTDGPMTFGELWARGVDALLRRELDVALRAFEEAAKLRPDDAGVQANLLRLNQMGVGKKAGVGR